MTSVNQDITNSIQCDSDEIQVIDTGKYRYERLKYKGLGDQAIKDKIGEKKAGDYLAYTVDYGNNYENEKKDNENPYFEATYFGNVDNITVNGHSNSNALDDYGKIRYSKGII
jgi:hypothetical protein